MTTRTENGNNDTSLAANCEILYKILSSRKNTVCLETLFQKSKPIWRLNVGETAAMLDCIERNFSRLNGTDNGDQSKNKKQGRHQAAKHVEVSVFPASSIIIGSWQNVAHKEGDIMVKWQYTDQKMAWEFLEGGFKKKIQIAWTDIISIKADLHPTEPQTLQVELGRPPSFHVDGNYPEPRRHCLWQPSKNFTCNQASLHRRQYLQFPLRELGKPYHKLLQCKDTLYIIQ